MSIFPSAKLSAGDLLFFYKSSKINSSTNKVATNEEDQQQLREAITAASVVDDARYQSIFHVGLVIDGRAGEEADEQRIVHASDEGVVVQSFADSCQELKPHFVELCHVELDNCWKKRAAQWALEQLGSEYNDIYSPECINSSGKRAFYCSQLVGWNLEFWRKI
jgi:uncharacterized protein YycO